MAKRDPASSFSAIAELGDPTELADAVDELAVAAAGGSSSHLESLLFAIDHHRLADAGVRRVVMDDDAVDDVYQDVLIAVCESISTWRQSGRFTSWLHIVGRNKAIAYVRRRHPVPDQERVDNISDSERISSLIVSRSDAENLVRSLPELYREAVLLRDIQGLPYDQVADALKIPLNTARSRIHRGRALLAPSLTG